MAAYSGRRVQEFGCKSLLFLAVNSFSSLYPTEAQDTSPAVPRDFPRNNGPNVYESSVASITNLILVALMLSASNSRVPKLDHKDK